jgi:hypothetical protein
LKEWGAGRMLVIIRRLQAKDTAGCGPRAARRIIGLHPWHGQTDQTEPWSERIRWCRNAWLPKCPMRNLLVHHQGPEILPSLDAIGRWLVVDVVNAPLLLVLGSRRHAANHLGFPSTCAVARKRVICKANTTRRSSSSGLRSSPVPAAAYMICATALLALGTCSPSFIIFPWLDPGLSDKIQTLHYFNQKGCKPWR